MISKEQAQERLKAYYNPNHSADQVARLGKLPDDLSTLGQILIQAGPAWQKLQKEINSRGKIRSASFLQIKKLNQKERQKLFTALFPGIAPILEDTWKLFDQLPYQTSYARKPFRNPHHPTLDARIAMLQVLVHALKGYDHQEITWLAAWAPHLGYYGSNELGYLFAATIEKGDRTGNEVFEILIASANGTHETGTMGRHVVRALLCSSRVDGWEYIERMLLAAQREEGLRQVILESIDEAHPQAFRRILRLVLDHKLIRFSATIRALGVWFGLPFEAVNQKVAHQVLEQVLRYLDSPTECKKAVKTGEPQDVYYALWAMAFDDVLVAFPHAATLSRSDHIETRFVAVHFLGQTALQESMPELLNALDDEDFRVSAHALMGLTPRIFDHELVAASDMFERLERLLPRVKHKQNNMKPLVWDWLPIALNRELISGELIDCLGKRSPKRLIPYLSLMSPRDRARVARVLKESKHKDEETIQTLILLVGDLSPDVREEALKGLKGCKLKDTDIAGLENLLLRQSQDLRRGIIQLLLGLSDKKLFDSVRRLLQYKGVQQRLAALELLRECKQTERTTDQIQSLASEYKQRATLSDAEAKLLEELLADSMEKYSLDNALGLMDPQNRTKPVPIKARLFSKVKLGSSAAATCLKSLDALVDAHRNDVIELERGNTKTTELLGNMHWGWMFNSNRSLSNEYATFPLKELCETWWEIRPKELRDEDRHELLRALVAVSLFTPIWARFSQPKHEGVSKELQKHFDLRLDFHLNYQEIVRSMVEWLIWAHPETGETDYTLNALEESVGRIPHKELTGLIEIYGNRKGRAIDRTKLAYLDLARRQRELRPELWKDEHHARLWKVVCWLNEPEPGYPGEYAILEDALFAFQSGAATRDDLFYMFLGPRKRDETGYEVRFDLLYQFSARKVHAHHQPFLDEFPVILEIVETCRERILDVECRRGELPTVATSAANQIRSVPGMRNLFRMLVALGESGFERGYLHGQSRSGVFSHLIRNSYPLESDTLDEFVQQVHNQRVPEKRLIELAVYAPQWAGFVQHATGWNHLTETVWWLYAHTKDRQWTVEQSIREEWVAWIAEYTPLSANDLLDGAVDVAWFQRVYAEIGEARWQQLYDAALYTSGGIGHGRARLFADAMLGRVTTHQLTERIRKKRHQDSARALGLIPFPEAIDRKLEILQRYEVLQEFLRTSRKFGSQRQASEKLAVSIGMQNLARTAGYADPQRLEWAMEIEAVIDLSSGPVRVNVDEFQFTLSIDDLGEPTLVTTKKDKPIKTIPAVIKKNEKVSVLLERKQKLDRQVSRMRLSLEQAMCNGDEFTAAELQLLFRHPMLKTMLEQLVFVSPHGLGYPIQSGTQLFGHNDKEISLVETDPLRIAHPLDLMTSKVWHDWQRECFIAERIQPFKQIFRELYVSTATEKEEGNLSRRYAGQQVNPRQAVALFGGRGWVVAPEEGVQKTFHMEGISARVGFLQGIFTPAEVEGLTLETVVFTKRGEWNFLPLDQVPGRIFSEVMRDLDLVVSVAHAGGIDPESSASSIEARSALIRETCTLLKLANVQLSEKHALIDGKLSNYNVNLGSGTVHKQPGGALCIIPVHSQHRGRIFLPFVDNDPKTAEIVSKVILLARDDQIKDPTILEQIL